MGVDSTTDFIPWAAEPDWRADEWLGGIVARIPDPEKKLEHSEFEFWESFMDVFLV